MSGIVELQLWQFALVYVLLLVAIAVMRACGVSQTKQLLVGNVRMAIQLVIAGLILTFIFDNPHPLFTAAYLAVMVAFSIARTLNKNPGLNARFKVAVGASLAASGLLVLAYFIVCVVGESFFNPQYAIPLAGMIMGNSMNATSVAVRAFREGLVGQRARINALLCAGAEPRRIMQPFARSAIETAIMPTINTIMGLGIVSLPGMMTGQILSGTLPMVAILYQIAIFVAIACVVMLSCVGSLFIGMRSLYGKDKLIDLRGLGEVDARKGR